MKKIIIMLLAVSLLFPAAAFSMSGIDVYNKYKKQEKKLEKKAKSTIIEHQTKADGIVMKGKVYNKGKKTRVESTMVSGTANMMIKPGETMIMIDDGKTTTTISPSMGTRTYPNDDDDEEDVKPRSVDYLGKEKVSGINCHKIRAHFLYNEVEDLWIDAKEYVLVKEVSGFEGEKSTTINSDFKKIKGFIVPFKTIVYENGNIVETVNITSVKINTNIKDSLFNAKKVKGYKASKSNNNGMNQMNKMDQIMAIGMQIQQHYQNGEPEKAKALEKKLKKLTGQN